ncbi:MAG: formyltransferase family protein [Chloroflexota bacterium]
MRLLFFGNNKVGWQIAEWLHGQGETMVGVVLHPEAKRKFGAEIIHATGIDPSQIIDGSTLREPATIEAIKALNPEVGVSALFGYILRREALQLLPAGCVNIHPAYLPYNRGSYPNVWSIIEGTPAGVTIHYIDEGVDTGDLIAQRQVTIEPTDTGGTLYQKLEQLSVDLFKETWPLISAGQAPRVLQAKEAGTTHRVRDVDALDEIDLDRTYTGRELLNILRARTFPPYKGAYLRDGDHKVYLRLELLNEDQL